MTNIYWPAVVKLTQNDELLYLATKRDWLELACLYQHHFSENDTLIDSSGATYQIVNDSLHQLDRPKEDQLLVAGFPGLALKQEPISLTEFIQLVRAHAQAVGQCCSAKLAFSTLAQGIDMVKYLDEQDT